MIKSLAGYLAVWIIGVGALCLIASAAHCSTTTKKTNSLGFVAYLENPYVYKMGFATGADVVANGKATNIRIQPAYTYQLFDEELLVCGDQTDRLEGTSQPMVVTYERVAHRLVEGIACHDLVGVNEIKPRRINWDTTPQK